MHQVERCWRHSQKFIGCTRVVICRFNYLYWHSGTENCIYCFVVKYSVRKPYAKITREKFPIDWCMGLSSEYFTAKRYRQKTSEILQKFWHSKNECPTKCMRSGMQWLSHVSWDKNETILYGGSHTVSTDVRVSSVRFYYARMSTESHTGTPTSRG